ncbi:MAG: phospholipase D family protein [Polyangiaceae bacterium]
MTEPRFKRSIPMELVWGREHYDIVIASVRRAKTSVWIATANLKDVHVEARVGTRERARGRFSSLFEELGERARQGVEIRILSAGPPSRALTARLATKTAARAVEVRRCVRLHMKMIAVDGTMLYLGSANFTGAGLGAKGDGRRNFEAGIVTSDDVLLDRMQQAFEGIWSGGECAGCRVRGECPKPIDELVAAKARAAKRG